jgi:hypothetical protein
MTILSAGDTLAAGDRALTIYSRNGASCRLPMSANVVSYPRHTETFLLLSS